MTKTAKVFGKDLSNFMRSRETKDYMEVISNSVKSTELIEASKGRQGGTWAHPKLAVFYWATIYSKFIVNQDLILLRLKQESGHYREDYAFSLDMAKHVASVLGYEKARNALKMHIDQEDKNDAVIHGPLGGNQHMVIINESGMYSLIFGSKLEADYVSSYPFCIGIIIAIQLSWLYSTSNTCLCLYRILICEYSHTLRMGIRASIWLSKRRYVLR